MVNLFACSYIPYAISIKSSSTQEPAIFQLEHRKGTILKMKSWKYFSVFFLILYHQVIYIDSFIPLEDVTVREWEPVDLLCNYKGDFLSWRYYTNEFDNQGDYISGGLHVAESFQEQFTVSYNQTAGIYILHIERPKFSFTGYYKCAYLNSLVSVSILRVTPASFPICVTYFLDVAQSHDEVGQVSCDDQMFLINQSLSRPATGVVRHRRGLEMQFS